MMIIFGFEPFYQLLFPYQKEQKKFWFLATNIRDSLYIFS